MGVVKVTSPVAQVIYLRQQKGTKHGSESFVLEEQRNTNTSPTSSSFYTETRFITVQFEVLVVMMKMKRVRSSLVALCLLVCSGLALDCELDQVSDHGLNMIFLESGRLTKKNVSDPEGCKAACCDQPDCDLALVGHPSDGGPQCFLVDCRHRNVCVLQENKQFSVYRKKGNGEAGGEATEGGERVHIAPLLDLKEEPKDEESNNSKLVINDKQLVIDDKQPAIDVM